MRLGLPLLIFIMASTALAGIGVIAVLAAGFDGWQPIVIAAAIGAIAAIPATLFATKQIRNLR